MPSPLGKSRLEEVEEELRHVAVQIQQLTDRQAMLEMLEDFRNSNPLGTKDAQSEHLAEMESLRKMLRELSEKEERLQRESNQILYPKSKQEGIQKIIVKGGVPVLPASGNQDIVPPPPIPAPQVILDLENLPACPTQTACPLCQQYIVTETVSRVGGVTWLVCVMCALVGCVAGCCLLPFCMKSFKDTVHRCPKCRSEIHTNTKL
ncbi:hypothetical protein GN956_G2450 [Arapaima gigas]